MDSVVTSREQPQLQVECKWSDARVARSLRFFKGKFPPAAAWKITADGIRVAPALALLSQLA